MNTCPNANPGTSRVLNSQIAIPCIFARTITRVVLWQGSFLEGKM